MLSIDAVDTHETEKPTDRRNESNRVIQRGIASTINFLAQLLSKEQPVAFYPEQALNDDSSPTSMVTGIHRTLVEDEK